MSLIRVRNSRKREGLDVKRGRSPKMLLLLLILVIVAIWFLGIRF